MKAPRQPHTTNASPTTAASSDDKLLAQIIASRKLAESAICITMITSALPSADSKHRTWCGGDGR